MSTGTQAVESELIESVCERVRERVAPDEVEEAEAFVRAYYKGAPAEDLRGREPVDLYGAALSHWTFGRERDAGTALVRVYNPTFEQHGWQSPHTAIDIVSDDMPFLVDSVSMELSRREAGIHVLVHPVIGDESYMHIEIDRQADGLERAGATRCGTCSAQVRAAVEDWQPMKARLQALIDEPAPAGVDPAEVEESKALLRVDRRPPLHVPRLPRVLAHRRGAARRRGHRARAAARRRRPRLDRVRQAAAGGARVRAGAASAGADEGQRALARAPAELPRLRRRQALRRRRQGRRRAALPRALHRRSPTGRLPLRDPDAAPHRRTRCSSAPGSRAAATTTRRSTRSSTRSRATSSSR